MIRNLAPLAYLLVLSVAALEAAAQHSDEHWDPRLEEGPFCEIRDLECLRGSGKCNIKFVNRTGVAEGSSGCGGKKSTASASTIKVQAQGKDRGKLGRNLEILAGDNKTMNLENRFDPKAEDPNDSFSQIKIWTPVNPRVEDVHLDCKQIRQILDGGDRCKVHIWQNESPSTGEDNFFLNVSCDGGDICWNEGPRR